MLNTHIASQGLLFGSFLFREDLYSESDLTKFWEEKFGSSFGLVPKENPLATYYAKEMGEPLSRKFLITTNPFPREFLLSSKLQALEWERNWSENNLRRVNVDIGFLTAENFLLATTKNYSHRIYLGQNIFADLTYYFHQGAFQNLPWTYPDYLDEEKKQFISFVRIFLIQNGNA